MNHYTKIKNHFSRLFPFTLALGLMVGCASVTDANIDAPAAELTAPAQTTTQADASDIWDSSNGDDMDPIIDRPKSGGTYYD